MSHSFIHKKTLYHNEHKQQTWWIFPLKQNKLQQINSTFQALQFIYSGAGTWRETHRKKTQLLSLSFADVLTCSTHNTHPPTTAGTFLTTCYCLTPSLRLHLEQTGCSPDATLWERLHCDKGAGRSSWRRRAVQIPLREAQNVCRRWNTQPLPWLWGSRGRNGKLRLMKKNCENWQSII